MDKNKFTADLIFSKTYTQEDVNRIKNIIVGNITPTNSDYEKYDLTKSGKISAADLLMVQRLANGLETGNAKFILNTNEAENAIILQNDTGGIVTNIGRFGAYINNIKTGSLTSNNVNTDALVVYKNNDFYIFIGTSGYNNTDTSAISLSNNSGTPTINLYGEFGRIEADVFQVNNAGYSMYGKDTGHVYKCDWQGDSRLHFYVDITDVGNVSDKRLKTDIKEVDEDLIKAIGELNYKQFKKDNRNGLVSVGIIAQDLIEILNKYGKNAKDYELLEEFQYKLDDETLYYRIDYEQFLLLRMMAKEKEIKELQEKDKQKDNLIQSLIERIEKLEAK